MILSMAQNSDALRREVLGQWQMTAAMMMNQKLSDFRESHEQWAADDPFFKSLVQPAIRAHEQQLQAAFQEVSAMAAQALAPPPAMPQPPTTQRTSSCGSTVRTAGEKPGTLFPLR